MTDSTTAVASESTSTQRVDLSVNEAHSFRAGLASSF